MINRKSRIYQDLAAYRLSNRSYTDVKIQQLVVSPYKPSGDSLDERETNWEKGKGNKINDKEEFWHWICGDWMNDRLG